MAGLALFDLDDTLLDREAAFSRWARGFAQEHRLPEESLLLIEQADMDGLNPRQTFFEAIRETFGISLPVEDLLVRYYIEYPAYYTVSEKTVDAIRRLRSHGWKLGVVTNGPPSQLSKLEHTNLVDEVDAICISEVVGVRKPDPVIFREAARRCGVPLKGWMVGDSESTDIIGGYESGLRTIWMSRGRTWESTEMAPDVIAMTLSQAVDVIIG
jgi:putative hydrolase of the HAD superfamily